MDGIPTDLPSKVDETLEVCPRYASSHLSLLDLNPVILIGFESLSSEGLASFVFIPCSSSTAIQTGVGKSSLISTVFNMSLNVRERLTFSCDPWSMAPDDHSTRLSILHTIVLEGQILPSHTPPMTIQDSFFMIAKASSQPTQPTGRRWRCFFRPVRLLDSRTAFMRFG